MRVNWYLAFVLFLLLVSTFMYTMRQTLLFWLSLVVLWLSSYYFLKIENDAARHDAARHDAARRRELHFMGPYRNVLQRLNEFKADYNYQKEVEREMKKKMEKKMVNKVLSQHIGKNINIENISNKVKEHL